MRTNEEQGRDDGNELREIAQAIMALEAQAKRLKESTLAYLLDMAAMEAEGGTIWAR